MAGDVPSPAPKQPMSIKQIAIVVVIIAAMVIAAIGTFWVLDKLNPSGEEMVGLPTKHRHRLYR